MKLHFRALGEGKPLIILHGVFGSSDNWQTLGKVFSEKFNVFLVDLRNHGNSPHSDVFDYQEMVKDVIELMDNEALDSAYLLGHSMGGKVAMHLSTQHPDRVAKLIVVDIAPKYYPPHHQQIFDGFHAVDLSKLQSRKEADEQMASSISNAGIRQFILKNLNRDKDGNFSWKLNVQAIENAVERIGAGLEDAAEAYSGETFFIGGGNSDYIKPEDHKLIKTYFPNSSIVMISGAGHWVHAEKPVELSKAVLTFLT